jgi:hypothetical protein
VRAGEAKRGGELGLLVILARFVAIRLERLIWTDYSHRLTGERNGGLESGYEGDIQEEEREHSELLAETLGITKSPAECPFPSPAARPLGITARAEELARACALRGLDVRDCYRDVIVPMAQPPWLHVEDVEFGPAAFPDESPSP